MKRLVTFPLAVVVAFVVATSAHAVWVPAAKVGPTAEAIRDPALTFTGGGSPLFSGTYSDTLGTGSELVFGPVGAAPLRATLLAPPATYGATKVAYLRTSSPRRPVGRFATVGLSLGSRSDLGRLRVLSRRADGDTIYGGRAALAANRRGDIAAAWEERRGENERLMLAVRKPGGKLGRPSVLVGTGLISSITLALSERGDLVVAFQHNVDGRGDRAVKARVRPAGGRFGPIERLGPTDGISQIDAEVAADGRAVVAYGTQDGGEEAGKPWVVRAVLRRAGGRFGSARVLDPGEAAERPAGTVAAAIARDGSASVAWSGITGRRLARRYPARIATALPGRAFGAAQELHGNGAVTDLAARRDGTMIVVWGWLTELGNNQFSDQIFANVRSPGAGTFGAAEAVSPRERAGWARVGFNPRTGTPTVAWVGQPGSPPLGQAPYALPEVLRWSVLVR